MAKKWKAPFDPVEVKDYKINWEAEMTASEDTIATSVFELPAEAVTDGLAIQTQSNTTTDTTVWFHVPSVGDQEPMLGKTYEVENTITTASGRTLNVSAKLRVLDK
jgi:hypothetical protein